MPRSHSSSRRRTLRFESLEDRRVCAVGVQQFVSDINTTSLNGVPQGSDPSGFFNASGTAFFFADDGVRGRELWKSDGTAAGTKLIEDFTPGNLSHYTAVFDTDVRLGDPLLVVAQSSHNGNSDGLWKIDAATGKLEKLVGERNFYVNFTVLNDRIFVADGRFLKEFDVTSSAFRDIDNVRQTREIDADITGLKTVGDRLFFTRQGYIQNRYNVRYELWTSDGTAEGTRKLIDARLAGNFTVVGDTTYFTAQYQGKERLMRFTGGKTESLLEFTSTFQHVAMKNLTPVGNDLYFVGDDGVHGEELWKLAAGSDTPQMVNDIVPGEDGSRLTDLVAFKNVLYFQADDGVHGAELWKSDGTSEGTVMVRDFTPGKAGDGPSSLTVFQGKLYFAAKNGNDVVLWKSDGTAAGSLVVPNPTGMPAVDPQGLTVAGRHLYYSARNDQSGRELWRVEGVNVRPVADRNRESQFATGFVDTIGAYELSTFDADGAPSQVTYTVTKPPRDGRLESVAAAGVTITQFTQDDINHGRILYVRSGAEASDASFTFTVSDGDGATLRAAVFRFSRLKTPATTLTIHEAAGVREVWLQDLAGQANHITVSATDDGYLRIANELSEGPIFVGTRIAGVKGSGTSTILIPLTSLESIGRLRIATGKGNDTVDLRLLNKTSDLIPVSGLSIDFGGGNDVIRLSGYSTPNRWLLNQRNGGTLTLGEFGDVSFTGAEELIGGFGRDTFEIPDAMIPRMKLNDSSYGNVLNITADADMYLTSDFAAQRSDFTATKGTVINGFNFGFFFRVTVYGGPSDNLINTSTSLGVKAVYGMGGDDVLWTNGSAHGGNGNDVIVGSTWQDTWLSGDAGNDIVIGGYSGEDIVGGAGNDLLISGATIYDRDVFAQRELLQAWTSDTSYDARIKLIRDGGVGPRKLRLNRSTVTEDHNRDRLTGGEGRDWFLAELWSPAFDANDHQKNETITDIGIQD